MRNTKLQRGRGWRSDVNGSVLTHRWIMAIIFAGFVVVGLLRTKSLLTISGRGQQKTYIDMVIFNRPMGLVTIEKEVNDGNQK